MWSLLREYWGGRKRRDRETEKVTEREKEGGERGKERGEWGGGEGRKGKREVFLSQQEEIGSGQSLFLKRTFASVYKLRPACHTQRVNCIIFPRGSRILTRLSA